MANGCIGEISFPAPAAYGISRISNTGLFQPQPKPLFDKRLAPEALRVKEQIKSLPQGSKRELFSAADPVTPPRSRVAADISLTAVSNVTI